MLDWLIFTFRKWNAIVRVLCCFGIFCSSGASAVKAEEKAKAKAKAEEKAKTEEKEEEVSGEYKTVIDQAVREYKLGNWFEALVLFKKAHRIYPSARTLRGMGLTAFEDKRYGNAIRWLSEALEYPVRPLSPPMRKKIEQILQRAKEYVGFYNLEIQPPSATITIDGREAFVEDGILRVDPGDRRIVVSAEGYHQMKRRLTVKGGDNGVLDVELTPVPSPETEPLLISSSETSEPIEDGEEDSGSHLLDWILIGSGAALMVGGGTVLGLMIYDYSTVRYARGTVDQIEAAQDRVPLYSTIGFSVAGAGVACAGLGLFLLTLGEDKRESQAGTDDDLTVRMGANGIFIHGGF